MSKIEYDLNAAGSIMQEIQKLIKPPDEDTAAKIVPKPPTKHPYYKRPGRGHNHDCCDACQEGGALICCDRCPSSFHLQCHDPPLTQEDIPHGQWLCHNCRMTLKAPSSKAGSVERALSNKATESDQSRPNTPASELDPSIPPKIRNLRKRSSSHISVSSDTSVTEKVVAPPKIPAAVIKALDPNKKPTPLDELIRAASIMNPKQFELPREMELHCQFPGSDKVEPCYGKNGPKKPNKNNNRLKPYELDSQGLVPLPARTCFYCRKSCKKAPLVACDYCPLYFHQDCLDPPLTALPTGLWMCPNHAEQFIDWKLVSSISATERIKLWNRFAGPVDQESVKTEFFRRVHTKNPPFRYKVTPKPRDRAEIPPMVEYHYRNPPPLLPSLRDVLRCNVVTRQGLVENDVQNSEEDLTKLIEEDLQALQSANKKLKEFRKDIGDPDLTDESVEEEVEERSDEEEKAEIIEQKGKSSKKNDTNEKKKSIAKADDSKASETKGGRRGETKSKIDEFSIAKESPFKEIKEEIEDDDTNSQLDIKIDTELQYLDVDLIKALAFQRLQQIIIDHPDIVVKYRNRTAAQNIREICQSDPNRNLPLPSQLLTKDDIERIARTFTENEDFKIDPDMDEYEKYRPVVKTEESKAREIAIRLEPTILASRIRARAVLTPVGDILEGNKWFTNYSLEGSVYMRYRSFVIGSGPGSDLNLSSTEKCCQISPKHALIFYDEITRSFELINYSEFGTEVSGQLYSCDFTEHPTTPAKPYKDDPKSLYTKVQQILDKRRGIKRFPLKLDDSARMSAPESALCKCKSRPQLISGWEGTAILTHGTLIRFGCLPFVFSITEFDTHSEEES